MLGQVRRCWPYRDRTGHLSCRGVRDDSDENMNFPKRDQQGPLGKEQIDDVIQHEELS